MQALLGSRSLSLHFLIVLTLGGQRVHLGPVHEHLLGELHVLGLSLPRLKHRSLQRPSVGKAQLPRLALLHVVDGVQVVGGGDLRLAPGQEHDSRHGGRNGPPQGSYGRLGNLRWRGLGDSVVTAGDHVGFQESSLQVDVMVAEGFVDSSQNFFGDFLAPLNGMVAVGQNFGFNDWHNSVHLADRSISEINRITFKFGNLIKKLLDQSFSNFLFKLFPLKKLKRILPLQQDYSKNYHLKHLRPFFLFFCS